MLESEIKNNSEEYDFPNIKYVEYVSSPPHQKMYMWIL